MQARIALTSSSMRSESAHVVHVWTQFKQASIAAVTVPRSSGTGLGEASSIWRVSVMLVDPKGPRAPGLRRAAVFSVRFGPSPRAAVTTRRKCRRRRARYGKDPHGGAGKSPRRTTPADRSPTSVGQTRGSVGRGHGSPRSPGPSASRRPRPGGPQTQALYLNSDVERKKPECALRRCDCSWWWALPD
jgi:hypothetical protein